MAKLTEAGGSAVRARAGARELIEAFDEHRLLTFASATAFQILTAIVPFVLFALALLAFFDLEAVWREDVATRIAPSVSPAAFSVIDTTVMRVLSEQQVFWLTLGLGLAIWQVSGAVRAVMDGLDLICDCEDGERSMWTRYRRSVLLALALAGLFLLTMAVVLLGPLVVGSPDGLLGAVVFLVRWVIGAALLALAVGLMFRYAPARRLPVGWAGRGSLIVVGAWVGASLLFGFYLKNLASYGSVFGALASIVILFAYVYLSTGVFFVGAEIEARLREEDE